MVVVVRLPSALKQGGGYFQWKDPLHVQFGCTDIVNMSMMIPVPCWAIPGPTLPGLELG